MMFGKNNVKLDITEEEKRVLKRIINERMEPVNQEKELVEVTTFELEFVTVDGEIHHRTVDGAVDVSDYVKYFPTICGEYSTRANVVDVYLQSNSKFLMDDDLTYYPISSVVSIKAINVETHNAVKRNSTWYSKDKILK